MNQDRAEKIVTLVRELLEKMTISAEVHIEESALPLQGEFVCHIRISEGSNLLIGQRGLNLEALQTIARLSARRIFDGWADFSLDVNDYWKKKSDALFEEAREAERKASADKSAVFLRPMTAFERKCVHTLLADSAVVTTESAGSGEGRKVIVKPKGDLE